MVNEYKITKEDIFSLKKGVRDFTKGKPIRRFHALE